MMPGDSARGASLPGTGKMGDSGPSVDPRFSQGPFLMHLNRGRQLLRAGRLEQACSELECARKLRGQDEAVLNLLGAIYFRMERREEAIRTYRTLLQLHPESDVLHANIGVLEYKEGRLDDARRRLETAVLLNPSNHRPRLYLGLIERREGNLAACLDHLRAAGAHELAARIETSERGGPAQTAEEVDTGPMRAVDAAAESAPCLERLLEVQENVTCTSGEASFQINRGGGHAGADTLSVDFMRAMCVRAGRALYVDGAVRAEETREPAFVALKGRGHVEISSTTGGVLLARLEPGQSLCVGADRLLAFEAGITVSSGGGAALSHVMGEILTGALHLSGEGVIALAAGRRPRLLKLRADETLLASPRDLLCWTDGLRARPNSPGRLDDLLRPADRDGAGAIRLEGEGEAILDLLT